MKTLFMCWGAAILYPFICCWFWCKNNIQLIIQAIWTMLCAFIAGFCLIVCVASVINSMPIICCMSFWCYWCSAYAGMYDYKYIARRYF